MAVEVETRRGADDPVVVTRPDRRWRWPIRLAAAALVLVVVAGAALLTLLGLTPSARSAPARVDTILAAHGAPSDGGVVPAKVGQAILATEDSRFYSDWAIDPQGAVRAVWGVVSRNPDEGGATIEVQLAKMLYTPGGSDPISLTEQVAMAIKLDQDFSKTQILAMYLDAAYFGDGAYGVTDAAEHYFGVPTGELTWGQASLLAGLVQAPSRYDPHGHLTAALARRAHVLARLVAVGTLTRADVQAIKAEPLQPVVPFYG